MHGYAHDALRAGQNMTHIRAFGGGILAGQPVHAGVKPLRQPAQEMRMGCGRLSRRDAARGESQTCCTLLDARAKSCVFAWLARIINQVQSRHRRMLKSNRNTKR